MKVIEILKLCEAPLNVLHRSCIKIEDCRYIGLFDDFQQMNKMYKVTYCVSVLAQKYGISERKAYALLSKFKKDCKIGATE